MANRSKVDQIERERPGAYTRSDRVTSAEAERKNYQTTRPSEYTKSQAVLDAEAALKDYQAQRPGDYTKSQAVLDAEAAIKNYQAQRPGDYESQYGAQIDSLLEQIQNRKACGWYAWWEVNDESFPVIGNLRLIEFMGQRSMRDVTNLGQLLFIRQFNIIV